MSEDIRIEQPLHPLLASHCRSSQKSHINYLISVITQTDKMKQNWGTKHT